MPKCVAILFLIFCYYSSHAQKLKGSFENKFNRYQKGQNFNGKLSNQWDVIAWKRDRIHTQLVLWSHQSVNHITYQVSDLVGPAGAIPADRIRLRFGKYVKGDAQAKDCDAYKNRQSFVEIADALSEVPLTSVSPKDPLKIWITVDIDSGMNAANYKGSIIVKAGSESLQFNINLEVVKYTLPKVADWKFHLDLWQFPATIIDYYNAEHPKSPITAWSDEHFELLREGYKTLVDMGQKAISAHIKEGALGGPSMIQWTQKADGKWRYDFTVFDRFVDSLSSWGIQKQINCFSPVGWNKEVIPYWDEASGSHKELPAAIGSANYRIQWDHFLREFRQHLITKNWFEKTVLYLDEVPGKDLGEVFSVITSNSKDWKIGLSYGHPVSDSLLAIPYDVSSILGVKGRKPGINQVNTFYTSCTQTIPNNYITVDNNPAEMTWMAWYALRQHYDGYLRWTYDYWQLKDPYDARDGNNSAGDFSMIYRGETNSMSHYQAGIRGELLREGIQDFEKAKILMDSLKASQDIGKLSILNEVIDLFDNESGSEAVNNIPFAQKILNDISAGRKGISIFPVTKNIDPESQITPKNDLGRLLIKGHSLKTIKVYNKSGIIYQPKTISPNEIDLSHLPDGSYVMELNERCKYKMYKYE